MVSQIKVKFQLKKKEKRKEQEKNKTSLNDDGILKTYMRDIVKTKRVTIHKDK